MLDGMEGVLRSVSTPPINRASPPINHPSPKITRTPHISSKLAVRSRSVDQSSA